MGNGIRPEVYTALSALCNVSSIGDGGTSAFLDGANSLPIVLFKKWGKSLGIKMEFFETALDLD